MFRAVVGVRAKRLKQVFLVCLSNTIFGIRIEGPFEAYPCRRLAKPLTAKPSGPLVNRQIR